MVDIELGKVVMKADLLSWDNMKSLTMSGLTSGGSALVSFGLQLALKKLLNIPSEHEVVMSKLQTISDQLKGLTKELQEDKLSDRLAGYLTAAQMIEDRVSGMAADMEKEGTHLTEETQKNLNAFTLASGQDSWREHYLGGLLRKYTLNASLTANDNPFLSGRIIDSLDIYSRTLLREKRSLKYYVEALYRLHAHFTRRALLLVHGVASAADLVARYGRDPQMTLQLAEKRTQGAAEQVAATLNAATQYLHGQHPAAFDLYRELYVDPSPDRARFALLRKGLPHELELANAGDAMQALGAMTMANPRQEVVARANQSLTVKALEDSGVLTQHVTPLVWRLIPVQSTAEDLVLKCEVDADQKNRYLADTEDKSGHYAHVSDSDTPIDKKFHWRLIPAEEPYFFIENPAAKAALTLGFKPATCKMLDPRVSDADNLKWQFARVSPLLGGAGGGRFDDLTALPFRPVRIAEIQLYTGAAYWLDQQPMVVRQLHVTYVGPNGERVTCRHGEDGYDEPPLKLAEGEVITELFGRTAGCLLQLGFKTNKGQVHTPLAANPELVHCHVGQPFVSIGNVVAFCGSAGALINSLGAYWAP